MQIHCVGLLPQDLTCQSNEIQSVYEMMYDVPAGHGRDFIPFLVEHSGREGFRFRAAIQINSGQMIGFGYGFTGRCGQAWRDGLADAVGYEMAQDWLIGHFEFAEFGIVPAWRQYGVGTSLYKVLFDQLSHEKAVLTVREGNEPARRFYDKQGWNELFSGFFSPTGRGPYAIMGKRLKANSMR